MRRLVAVFLVLFVPLQFAWVAAQGLHGHWGGDVSALGFHLHDGAHEHHDAGESTVLANPIADGDNGGDRHSGGHYHLVMVLAVFDSELKIHPASSNGRPPGASVSFTSRVPPPFDWPPSARS